MKSALQRTITKLSIGAMLLGLVSCSGGENTMSPNNSDPDGITVRADLYPNPLPSEEMLITDKLKNVNKGYVFVHDLSFVSLITGRVMVFDVLAKNRNYKGQISAAQFASFAQSSSRSELYVAETFYSRGVRGERTDVMAIYDLETLSLKHEIILPNNNRGLNVALKGNFQVSQDESLAFIFSFTPSSGVIVVDLDKRKIVNEISIPGCSMIYPFRQRGFSMLCGDGGMVAFDLDRFGQVISEYSTEEFHDIDNHPMFLTSAKVGDTLYWPTFTGQLVSVDFSSSTPRPMDPWNFVGDSGYLPSGWQLITSDNKGRLYIIMRANAQSGEHKYGGDEVWLLDPVAKKVVKKINVKSTAVTIEVLKTSQPTLVVSSYDLSLDIYDVKSKKHVRSIGGFTANDFYLVHASEFGQ